MTFRTLPLPTRIAERVRQTGKAPGYGHPALRSVAPSDGYGPCRHCLRRTQEGEGRLLFNYNPYFEMAEEVPVVGPIFIHEAPCEAFVGEGYPGELRGLPLVAEGHLHGGAGTLNHRLDPEDPEAALANLLADPAVAFITLRNAEAGCFVARIERFPSELGQGGEATTTTRA